MSVVCFRSKDIHSLFYFLLLQVATSPPSAWTSRFEPWTWTASAWSCRSGTRQDRSDSEPSLPRKPSPRRQSRGQQLSVDWLCVSFIRPQILQKHTRRHHRVRRDQPRVLRQREEVVERNLPELWQCLQDPGWVQSHCTYRWRSRTNLHKNRHFLFHPLVQNWTRGGVGFLTPGGSAVCFCLGRQVGLKKSGTDPKVRKFLVLIVPDNL